MCKTRPKCVLLAERHHGLLDAIRRLLQSAFEAVVMVADRNPLLESAEALQPALVVVELSLSPDDGVDLLRTMRERFPELKVIVLSMQSEPSVVRTVLEAGANAYVLKSKLATDLLPAAEAVLAGAPYVFPSIMQQVTEPFRGKFQSS
jgi:DNA-binding NarL/FixJ family response regulator